MAATISPARANAPSAPIPAVLQVLGSVTNAARPVANALVIALNVNSFEALQTYTTVDGKFVLPPLRAGVYKII
ncbi:MAG TPA: carboxypeptidase-like regulatory domain-containing protein, partial [Thermoanaerobaculia bacterium]